MDASRRTVTTSTIRTSSGRRGPAAWWLAAAVASLLCLTDAVAAAESPPVTGEVTKVDLHSGTITIRHGAIPTLKAAAAPGTDAFVVKDPVMLNALAVGRTIRFTAEDTGGTPLLASLLPAE